MTSRAAPGLLLAAALCLLQGPGLVHRDVFKSHSGLDDPGTCPAPQPPCQICAAAREPGLPSPSPGGHAPRFIFWGVVEMAASAGPLHPGLSPRSGRAPPLI